MALVMGVLNVTPDSFSDGGVHLSPGRALERAREMIAQGAAWIDVGGESTRPGARPVEPDEECRRVLPVLDAVVPLALESGVGVSIDTRNEATARAAVHHGATLLNDVAATLWPVAADLGVGWVAMHMLGDPRTMQQAPRYDDVVDDVRRFLVERAAAARDAGVPHVWVDPGIGFGKTTAHNLELLARLDVLVAEGFDVLVGTSRKRFTGELVARSDARVHVGNLAEPGGGTVPTPVDDRLEGSVGTAVWAIREGAAMVRAHDVAATVAAAAVAGGRVGGR